jgi:hypothetical protein
VWIGGIPLLLLIPKNEMIKKENFQPDKTKSLFIHFKRMPTEMNGILLYFLNGVERGVAWLGSGSVDFFLLLRSHFSEETPPIKA